MHLAVYVAGFERDTDTADCELDVARQLEYDVMVYLNILPAALFHVLHTTHHQAVTRLLDLYLVIIEISTSACRTDDLHLRRCRIRGGDFDGATNARDLNTRSRPQLVGLVNFVALLKLALLRSLCSEPCRSSVRQHHHACNQNRSD